MNRGTFECHEDESDPERKEDDEPGYLNAIQISVSEIDRSDEEEEPSPARREQ